MFSYHRPTSLQEALEIHAQRPGGAVYLAGGTDLLVKHRRKRIAPQTVISLNAIPGLDYIKDQPEAMLIGALTRLESLNNSPVVAERFPVLKDAVARMASVQIRNVATMAGNVVNAAPSADTAPPLLVLEAQIVLRGLRGQRRLRLEEFFRGPGQTALEPGEILTEFILPKPEEPSKGAYAKISRRRAMDLALLGVAVQLTLAEDHQTCRAARIGLGVAGPTPLRAREAEGALVGRVIDPESLAEAGRVAARESSCRDSLRGEAWYRREMIRVFVRRMGLLAWERLQRRER